MSGIDERKRSGSATEVTRNSTGCSEEEIQKLLTDYSPLKQARYCTHEERCVLGTAPTLKEVSERYGEQTTMRFLVGQLWDFAEFIGCRNRLSDSQYQGVARIVIVKFPYLKLSELMLFLFDCKMGKYGRFYGTIEPMTVLANLTDFVNNERGRIISAHDEREKAATRSRLSSGVAGKPLTYEEYLRIKVERHDFTGAFGADARKYAAEIDSNQPF